MDEIQQLMQEMFDSTRCYHERSKEQREFDQIVVAELVHSANVRSAMEKAIRKMPTMADFLTSRTMSEIEEYYSQLRRLELEIILANNVRMISKMRKRKAQQASGDERPPASR